MINGNAVTRIARPAGVPRQRRDDPESVLMDRPDRVDGSRHYTISYFAVAAMRCLNVLHRQLIPSLDRASKEDIRLEISFEQTRGGETMREQFCYVENAQ